MRLSFGWVLGLVAVGILGLVLGWILGRRRGAPTTGTGERGLADVADPNTEVQDHRVRELKRELRFEQSLLDGVAAANGVPPRDFRRALARDYLHAADPNRWKHLSDPVEVDTVGASEPSSDLDALRAQLTAKEEALDHTRQSIGELRLKVASLVEARRRALPAASDQVIDLRDEVAELRSQMADRALETDRLRSEIGRQAKMNGGGADTQVALAASQIDDILRQLSSLQERVQQLRPRRGPY